MKTICEYIWIDGNGTLRSKTRVLNEDEQVKKLCHILYCITYKYTSILFKPVSSIYLFLG